MTDSAVSKWERGLAYPDITLLQSICDILQISEKELLSASEDTEGRRAEQLARQYLRLLRNYRLIQHILYGLTLAAYFITNLAVQHTLSWFWIVLVGCALGASLTLLPVLAPEGLRGLWTLGGFMAALLLLAVCCVYTGGTWFVSAALWTLLGLGGAVLPGLMGQLLLPAGFRHKALLWLGVESVLLILCLAWESLPRGRFLSTALPIALLCLTLP